MPTNGCVSEKVVFLQKNDYIIYCAGELAAADSVAIGVAWEYLYGSRERVFLYSYNAIALLCFLFVFENYRPGIDRT
jgi:hypothetical protein